MGNNQVSIKTLSAITTHYYLLKVEWFKMYVNIYRSIYIYYCSK